MTSHSKSLKTAIRRKRGTPLNWVLARVAPNSHIELLVLERRPSETKEDSRETKQN